MHHLISLTLFLTFLSFLPSTTPQTSDMIPHILANCGFIPAPPTKANYGDIVVFSCEYDISKYYHAQPTLGQFSLVVGAGQETPTNTDFYFKSFGTTSGSCSFVNATANMVYCTKMSQDNDPNTFNVTLQVNNAIRSSSWSFEVVFTDSYDYQASDLFNVDINQPALSVVFSPSVPQDLSIGQVLPFSINLTNTGGTFSSPLECVIQIPTGVIPSGTLPAGCTVSGTVATCVTSANTPFGAGESAFYSVNLTANAAATGVVVNASCSDVKKLFGPYYPNVASSTPSATQSVPAGSPLPSSVAPGVSASPAAGSTTGTNGGSTTGGSTTGGGDGGGDGTTGVGMKLVSWLGGLKEFVL